MPVKILVTHSDDPNGVEAAADILAQAEAGLQGAAPIAGLLYTCIDIDHEQILASIRARFPDLPLIGCTTDGECSSVCAFSEDSTVLTLFTSDRIRVRAGLGEGVPTDVAAAAAQAVAAASDGGDTPTLCIALSESIGVSGVQVVAALNAALPAETLLVGGTAGDQWRFERSHQFFGDRVTTGALPILMFYGDFHASVGVASGWRPMGQRARVTKASGPVLFELDGRPAMEFFQGYFGEHNEPNPEYPFAVFEGSAERFYLRAPMYYSKEDGSIVFAGDVPEGAEVQITEAGRTQILDGAREAAHAALDAYEGTEPQAMLVFSCAARKQVLGTRCAEEIGILSDNVAPNLPIAGFYTYGEIGPLGPGQGARFHNETVVAALIGG